MEKQIVLYWYQAHGRVIASEYSGKLYLVVDAIRLNRTDATIVRVTTPFVGDDQSAIERATRFAQQIIDKVDTAVPL
jgi:EpsI family protein